MEVLGKYRLLGQLGEGGMGIVYLGEHTLLGRRAAIKVLLPEHSRDRAIVHRFFNEAKAVTQINDPGIVQVFDFGYAENGSAYIIMELLEGEPMDKRIARIGRFSPVDGLRLVRQICTSLSAAHAKGIVHRDLKPENLFLVSDPEVIGGERAKILDFGIAKLSGDDRAGHVKTNTGAVIGTPLYMSPEQCQGAGLVDHRSDIYSLGCVLMTMLTGQPPFDGKGSGDLIVAHMTVPAPRASARVSGMPQVVDDILQSCLAKNPGARFQSMNDLAKAVTDAEYALATGALGPRPSQPALRFLNSQATTLGNAASQISVNKAPQRSRAPLFAAIGVAAGLVGGSVAFLAKRSAHATAAAGPVAPNAGPAPEQPAVVSPVVAPPPPAAPPPANETASLAAHAAKLSAPAHTEPALVPNEPAPATKPGPPPPAPATIRAKPKTVSRVHAKPTTHPNVSTPSKSTEPSTNDVDRGD